MGRSDDAKSMDLFRAAPATAIGAPTYSPLITLSGMQAWSLSVFTNDGAKVNLVVQFTDFTNRTHLVLPDTLNNMVAGEVTQAISGTVGTPSFVRLGRFGDGTCAAAYMRVMFTPTTGSTGSLWAALTLRGC